MERKEGWKYIDRAGLESRVMGDHLARFGENFSIPKQGRTFYSISIAIVDYLNVRLIWVKAIA